MKSILGTSPRTTILGYLGAIAIALWPIINKETFDIHKDWKYLLIAAFTAVYGRISKDSNGITREQSKIVAKMATDGVIPPTPDNTDTAIQ